MVNFRTFPKLATLVASTAILCYLNILPNDFCYDDIPVVRDNLKVHGEGQWTAIWTTDYWLQTQAHAPNRDLLYRPVALSLFRIIRLIFGNHPLPFHVVSLVLHALCSVLVARLTLRLVKSNMAALIAGLVFAVLPIHSEVVASVVGQTDLLAAAGVLGAILCHLRMSSTAGPPGKFRWMLAAALCAFLAMGAKESGIAVVPLAILAALLGIGDESQTRRGLFSKLAWCSYLFIPLFAYLLLRHHALGGQLHQAPAPTRTVNVLVDAPAWQHALGVMQAWGLYWTKTIFPRELCIEYAINAVRLATSIWQAHVLVGLAWIVALIVIATGGWKRGRREIPFVIAALLIAYLPTSNALVLIQVFFAERIWYLPSVFVCILLAVAAARRMDRRRWRVVGVTLLAVMTLRCWIRNSEWRDNGTLFAAAYYDHPQSVMARYLYGQWLTQNEREEEGIAILERAIQIDLGFTDAHRALGLAWLRLGHHANAIKHLQIAQMQVPGDPITREALSRASSAAEAAIGGLDESTEATPQDVMQHLASIRLLRELGRTEDALKLLRERADQYPDHPEWAYETAVTLVMLNRRDEAIEAYRHAASLQNRPQIGIELAMLLIERQRGEDIDQARMLAQEAIDAEPNNPAFHAALGEILFLQGDRTAAQNSFRRAQQLADPAGSYAKILEERMRVLGL